MYHFGGDSGSTKNLSTSAVDRILPSWVKIPFPFQWNSFSMELLSEAEDKLLSLSNVAYSMQYVPLRDVGREIWTLEVDSASSQNLYYKPQSLGSDLVENNPVPLVLLHSLCGGIGLWVYNLNSLSRHRKVYAIDLLGFGKSSRSYFSSNANVAEIEWVESIEEWRISMGLESMHILGHGLGGFLATSYALRYPKRVRRLILVDPWGIAERPKELEVKPRQLPLWVRILSAIVRPLNPLSPLRALGPWASTLMRRLRPDLRDKFDTGKTAPGAVYDYLQHCNIRSPATGETAFSTLSDQFGWAQNPLITRIGRLPINIPISVIHGSRSWLDHGIGEFIANARLTELVADGILTPSRPVESWSSQTKLASSHVSVHIIPQAGHHVYSDQPEMFNGLVNRILCEDDAEPKTDLT